MSSENRKDEKVNPTQSTKWGEERNDNYGYASNQERLDKRGLEDWELVQTMEDSEVSIPYWFIAVFVVLLIVAVGLTFPFWGNRPGYERPWFDWGIPAGVAWVVIMSFVIYYFVDLRHVLRKRKEEKQKNSESLK
ncbi:MAG: hypothetical protein OEZ58_19575 [Gammaproteobacteria bacterium]|nr:hypothetical protein [Gammaproteobacteria bacterium]